MIRQQLILMGAASVIFSMAQAETPETLTNADQQSVTTDFSGKPPYKRTHELNVAADTSIARLEEVAAPQAGDRVVEFRGKPPHKRSVVTAAELESASFARFEELPEETAVTQRPNRVGPPGKYGRTLR